MKKRILSVLLVAAMVVTGLTACGSKKETSAPETAGETTAVEETAAASEGKILRVASEDPQVPLDMHLYTYSIIMKITDNVAESLLLTDTTGEVVPTLLTGMPELSEDMLTYTFELKDGVKFHNGATLTSDDVKYSLERVVRKASMASLLEKVEGYDEMVEGEADELTGIVVLDDTHFEIHLTDVYTPFLGELSTPYCAIYPAEACEAAGDDWGMTELYGTGPFKLVSYQTGVGAELVRFDDYHGNVAKLDGVKYTFIDDQNTGVLGYQKGDYDVMYIDSNLYPAYAETLADELYSFEPAGGYYIAFNVNEVPDVLVREAANYAIDRKALAENVLFGTVVPAANFLQPGLIGADPTTELFEYDPEHAKELLAEAGYPDGYDIELTVNTKYSTSITVATALQAQMKEAGFNVSVNQVDSAAWSDMKASGSITFMVANWYVDYNDPDSMLYPISDGRADANSIFWHNDEFKQLMTEGVQTDDTAERQEIYAKADAIATHQEFAASMLFNETLFYLKKPYVKDFEVAFTYRTMFGETDIEQ